MKILWITNDVLMPFYTHAKGKPTLGGSWISPLFFGLIENRQNRYAVLTPVVDGAYQKIDIDGIFYYSIPINVGDNKEKMNADLAKKYLDVIDDYAPDLIHIHGTEVNFGQLRKYVDSKIPIVCSIQGLISSYTPVLKKIILEINLRNYQSIKNLLGRGGELKRVKKWTEYSKIEIDILKQNNYFIGRTMWDKAHLKATNPSANYFHGEELLREVFYTKKWDINKCNKYTIFISSAAYPIKGFHVLLKAVALLKQKYPQIKIVTPLSSKKYNSILKSFLFEEDYSRFLNSEIKRYSLAKHIVLLNRLTAEEMADYFCKAHVFVLPSYVENSPNSLGEAMMIGTPSVVSFVGGVQNILKDEESALLFPSEDHILMACQIDRIFSDNELAIRLSEKAKKIANVRHHKMNTIAQYTMLYNEIIKIKNESTSHI